MIPRLSSETFCASPWAEVRINSDGSMNFCHYADRTLIPVPDNISTMHVDQYFNDGRTIGDIRRKMLEGTVLANCRRCHEQETITPVSFRHRRNLQFGIFPGDDLQPSFEESNLPNIMSKKDLKPRFYHVSLSNLCNFSCPMCWPADSSALGQDFRKAGFLPDTYPILADWTQGPAWQDFCQHLLHNDQIVCLHIMGGEPFYHKKFRALLQFLVSNHHTDFVFTVVTNGSIFDETLISLLKQFRSVQVEISLEAVTKVNDYLRYPGRTQDILANIERYLAVRDDRFDVILRTVPQIFSVWDYPKLLEWCQKRRLAVDSNIMFRPEFFMVSMLPDDIKHQIRSGLQAFVTNKVDVASLNVRVADATNRNISNNAEMVINALDYPQPDIEKSWMELVNYCQKLDAVRQVNLLEYVPWLRHELIKYGYASEYNTTHG